MDNLNIDTPILKNVQKQNYSVDTSPDYKMWDNTLRYHQTQSYDRIFIQSLTTMSFFDNQGLISMKYNGHEPALHTTGMTDFTSA